MQYTNIYDFAKQEVHPVYIRCGYWSDPDSQADNDHTIAEAHGCWSRAFDCYGNMDIFHNENDAAQYTVHNLANGVLRTLDFCAANGITAVKLYPNEGKDGAGVSVERLTNALHAFTSAMAEAFYDEKSTLHAAMYASEIVSLAFGWSENEGIDIRHEMEDELEFLKNEVAGGMK